MDETCRRILKDLRAYLDGECPEDLEEVIAQHLLDCPPCLDRADFDRELQALVAQRCRESAPPELRDRVLRKLEG